MSSEYNSKLISKLYSVIKFSEIERVLNEISEIADPVFIYPLFDRWKLYNYKEDPSSHYFISALKDIKSKEVLNVSSEIFILSKTLKDRIWVYPIFQQYNYFEEKLIKYAQFIIKKLSINDPLYQIFDFDLFNLLSYLTAGKRIDSLNEDLKFIIFNETIEYDNRKTALFFLLRINPKEEFNYFIENYNTYRSDDIDILLARELRLWKGNQIEKLKSIILSKGNTRAIELLNENEKKKQNEEKKTQLEKSIKFNNAQIVMTITELRIKINQVCISKPDIKSPIFTDNEIFVKQIESATDRDSFLSKCVEMRVLFRSISKNIKSIISDTEIKKILPKQNSTDYDKPLNRLIIYFHEKNIKIDEDLYGLRSINQIVNIITHPDLQKELIFSLQKSNLYDLYKEENWTELHKKLLYLLQTSLEKLHKNISQKN
jgi:hypothetical protein